MSSFPFARHILVQHKHEAEDVMRKLKEGEPFEKMAKKFSICRSARDGGLLGEIKKGKMIPAFEVAVNKMAVNEVSQEPLQTQFGYHIIWRYK
jgi:peptidyl-prolyl cis-trans isomerase C